VSAGGNGKGNGADRGNGQEAALRRCAEVTAASGSNFYFAFLPLPRPRREAIFCVYAFCRHVDDIVDEPEPGTDPRREIDAWRRRVDAVVDGTLADDEHPIAVGLAAAHARFPLRGDDLHAVLDGMEMDLDERRFQTADDLALYCERVAGRVGCLCLPVFGADPDRARPFALALGHAFQLTNILRDVPRDAREGRVYLPAEDLALFGVRPEDLLAETPSPAALALLRHESDRALALFDLAESRLPAEERAPLFPAQIMASIYRRLLETLRADVDAAWRARPSLPAPVKVLLATGVWLRDRALRLS